MNFNKPDTKLDECIFIAQKAIPADVCDNLVQDIEKGEWQPHYWRDTYGQEIGEKLDKELDIQIGNPKFQKLLTPFVVECGKLYNKEYSYYGRQIMYHFSTIRFNRYSPGQIMRKHHDHIHSLFDGKIKGVPVLSFILNFNDDYEGADLYFWNDTVVELGKGDICMFPSNWLFPHGVTEATKGIRYSAACWGW